MAVDEAMMRGLLEGSSPRTVRFFTWEPGCYSLGRFQPAEDLNECARREPGVSWVRRPTGGRGIYHGPELTYSVVAPLSDEHVSGTVIESYRKIAEALVAGLALLGVSACLAPKGDPVEMRRNPSCFDNPSDYELLYDGRKLVGSAQTRHGDVLLQHGSVLLDDPSEQFFAGLRFASPEAAREALEKGRARMANLGEALGRVPSPAEIVPAMARGFRDCWGIELLEGGLSAREEEVASRLEAEKYSSERWCYRI